MKASVVYVKVKPPGSKAWSFMRENGRMTRLRIHAVRFKKENIDKLLSELREMNPGHAFKAVNAWKETK